MIFGFNTDVKHGDTIYHVQSEARESELLLQTQVFVRGRCVGKKATSYAPSASQTQSGDTNKEQQLREQHRLVLDAIREGKLDSILDHPEPDALAGIKELVIFRFARPEAAPFYTQAVTDSGGDAQIKIEVEESGLPDSSVLVQANYQGRTATRKFLLRRAE